MTPIGAECLGGMSRTEHFAAGQHEGHRLDARGVAGAVMAGAMVAGGFGAMVAGVNHAQQGAEAEYDMAHANRVVSEGQFRMQGQGHVGAQFKTVEDGLISHGQRILVNPEEKYFHVRRQNASMAEDNPEF